MPKKTTIYDVAKQAGVAISTVSRVLNDSPYVSMKTKNRVKAAISDLHFHPQVSARNLARQKPQIIAVVAPTFTTPFFNEVLKGVKDEIKDSGLDSIVYNTGSDDPEGNFKGFLDRGIPDALIIFSINIDDEIHERLKDMPIPVVLVGSNHTGYNYFWWDNYKGGCMAAKHLVDQGFQNIGMIRKHSHSTVADDREKGFRETLIKLGKPLQEDYIVAGITKKHKGYSEEAGSEAIHILHNRGKMPEAVFCSNDAQAIGALHALDELNLNVPKDIAVMGYDNIKISKFINLTTINQKMYDIGVLATKKMESLIADSGQQVEQHVIDPELIVRKSTRKASDL
ncbi:MAG: LacI family DNA-binding transcriptional regulator [Balneolales bacterium]